MSKGILLLVIKGAVSLLRSKKSFAHNNQKYHRETASEPWGCSIFAEGQKKKSIQIEFQILLLCDRRRRGSAPESPLTPCTRLLLIPAHLPLNCWWLHGIAPIMFFKRGSTDIVHNRQRGVSILLIGWQGSGLQGWNPVIYGPFSGVQHPARTGINTNTSWAKVFPVGGSRCDAILECSVFL